MGLSAGLTTGCVLGHSVVVPNQTPETIAGSSLVQWWEVGLSEIVEAPTVGFPYGTVSAINDEGANHYNYANAIASQQPTYEVGGCNGMPSMALDGSNDFLPDTNSGAFANDAFGGLNKPAERWLVFQSFDTTTGVPVSCGANASTPLWDIATAAVFSCSKNSGGIPKAATTPTGNLGRNIMRVRLTSTQIEISINGTVVTPLQDFVTGNAVFTKDCIGGLNRNTFSVPFFGRLMASVTTRPLTSQQAIDMLAYLTKFTAPQTAPMLLINGDSLSFPPISIWPNLFAADNPWATIVNNSAPGQALFNYGYPNRLRDTMSNYDANRSISLLVFTFGSNDVVDGQTRSQIYTNTMSVCTQSKAAAPGRPIVLATIEWRGGLTAGEEAIRQGVNADLRNSIGAADYLWERDLLITAADYPALFTPPDQTHPNDLGNYYLYNGRGAVPGLKHWAQLAGFN